MDFSSSFRPKKAKKGKKKKVNDSVPEEEKDILDDVNRDLEDDNLTQLSEVIEIPRDL